jgi:lipopolysaccharide export system permease protein
MFMTFFIVMFILLLQFLWRYIDDLVGKGLDFEVIAELLMYASAGLVPMALPLSTLLASLMTLGNLGENNELLAMKSAGISLPRIMFPLIVVTVLISISAFFFSNNVLPYTNLKISTLLWDVRQQRPELQIRVGVFNDDIEGYSIKIASRDPKTNLMENVLIYDHRRKEGNLVVTVADSGYMQITTDEKFMIITLYNGYTYEEMLENRSIRRTDSRKFPARRNKFEEQVLLLELKNLGFERSNEDLFKSSFQAQNINQLARSSDSLSNEIQKRKESSRNNLLKHNLFQNPFELTRDSAANVTYVLNKDSLLYVLTPKVQKQTIARALASARSAKSSVGSTAHELTSRSKHMVRHTLEWHRKFALSFACFVFFFIGAPLGAIIRKGGLGMPVVVSVLFFVIYYVISLTGEKFARELFWDPYVGMWLSSFILFPLGVFLSYKATTDSVIMNADFYINTIKKFLNFKRKAKRFIKGF